MQRKYLQYFYQCEINTPPSLQGLPHNDVAPCILKRAQADQLFRFSRGVRWPRIGISPRIALLLQYKYSEITRAPAEHVFLRNGDDTLGVNHSRGSGTSQYTPPFVVD